MNLSASPSSLIIRTMSRSEIDLAIDWAAAEGWNPGLGDAEAFYAADPEGFLLALLDNEPVGCISAVTYGTAFGFIGFYIVRPSFRGRGYGLQLWNAAMNRRAGRTVGLDGVIDQQENYNKSGFQIAYRNIRYEGKSPLERTTGSRTVELSSIDFKVLLAYDSLFFPEPRPLFLRQWISRPGSIALGILHHQTLTGYGMIRPCRRGYKIGPLFADNQTVADDLLTALTSKIPSQSAFFLDIPEPNPFARELVQKYRMTKAFETARMYNARPPQLPLDRIFGVTSFELG